MNMLQHKSEILRELFPGISTDEANINYIGVFGQAQLAILYSTLFLPETVEYQGHVFLSWVINYDGSKKAFDRVLAEGKTRPEESFNFVEIGYLFPPEGRDISADQDRLLAELVAESWRNVLSCRYPNREWVVEVLTPESTGSSEGVRFYEVRE